MSEIKGTNPMNGDLTLTETLRQMDDRIAALEPKKAASSPENWTPAPPKGTKPWTPAPPKKA